MANGRMVAADWEWDGEHFVWSPGACMTTHQIAEVIGNTHQAVAQSERRALEKLRKKLTKRGWGNEDSS